MREKKSYDRKKELSALRAYLNKDFSEDLGRDFNDSEIRKIYRALGNRYRADMEIDAVIGEVMGWQRHTLDEDLKPLDPSELEKMMGDLAKKPRKTRLDSYGQIITSFIFGFLILSIFFSTSNLTSFAIIQSETNISYCFASLFFILGIVLFFIRLNLNKKIK
jgi:hypothetical protein